MDFCYSTNPSEPITRVLRLFDKAFFPDYMSTTEPSEPLYPPPQQEPAYQAQGKGMRVAQPLPHIPKKRQASIPDVPTSVPPAAIADLVGADQPLTDADLQGIRELIARHLKS